MIHFACNVTKHSIVVTSGTCYITNPSISRFHRHKTTECLSRPHFDTSSPGSVGALLVPLHHRINTFEAIQAQRWHPRYHIYDVEMNPRQKALPIYSLNTHVSGYLGAMPCRLVVESLKIDVPFRCPESCPVQWCGARLAGTV
jgi:hypothetical protein